MRCKISSNIENESSVNKKSVIKNFLIACVSVQFCYIGVNGVAVIQSTLNNKHGLGLTSSAITYGIFGISGIILNEILKTKLGLRNLFSIFDFM